MAAFLATGLVSAAAASAGPTGSQLIYAAPDGSGPQCSAAAPCSITTAQQAARHDRAGNAVNVQVILDDGTYRLAAPLDFGAADSGSPGHPVVWTAARGAHPILSGASRVTDWTAASSPGVWSTTVAAGSASRQLYVDGAQAPVAHATPSQLHFAGGWKGSAGGYDLTADPAAVAFFSGLTPSQLQQVEFDYPGGNGQWTDSKCRVQSLSGSSLTMDEPCWTDVTDRADFSQASGGLPSMSTSQMPASIQNARSLLHPGQWFLDQPAHTLYLYPLDGAKPDSLDVELPRLETLVQGAGTLARPVHDLTFSGLTFSYATWNAPSEPAGFADVQSNLHMTGANNQGMCSFSNPAGSCPWGLLTEPHANVSFTAADHITLTGDRFAQLGGAGLSIA
ncbi:MAG: right-handed parallel beta-helix repeat-containing protein, partial [Actinocrinis sp.]